MEHFVNARSSNADLPRPAGSMTGNIVFLMLSFPLGLIYFLIAVIGFSVGIGTLIIWIGLFILFVTLFTVRGLAEGERRMVSGLLHIPVSYRLPEPSEQSPGFLRRFGRMLRDPYTWTSTVYMILKLPIGIISFTLTLVLAVVSAALALMPLIYMVNLLINTILAANGIISAGIIIPGFIVVHGNFDWLMFLRSFIGVPVGIVTWIIARAVFYGMALASGELARALLGPGIASITARPRTERYEAPWVMEGQQAYTE